MAQVFSVANQKGGVGKTTTAMNLAVCLGLAAKECVLLDFDPQCNATSGLGLEALSGRCHPLLGSPDWQSAAQESGEGLVIVPGCRALAAYGTTPIKQPAEAAERLGEFVSQFDCALVDCPPSLGWLTRLALDVSTDVLIPIQCEYFAMEGLSQMVEAIQQAQSAREEALQIGGILLTMFDPSLELTHDVAGEVSEYFGDRVFRTVIPRDVAISEAPSHGMSVLDYAPRSRATRACVELCMEVIDRG